MKNHTVVYAKSSDKTNMSEIGNDYPPLSLKNKWMGLMSIVGSTNSEISSEIGLSHGNILSHISIFYAVGRVG